MHLRWLPLSGTYNTRDLGGYPTGDGCMTQWGVLFRSDVPHTCNDADCALLRGAGVRTVIDLRTAQQVEEMPSALASLAEIHYVNYPFAVGNRNPDFDGDSPNIYMEMLSDRANIARVMRLILKAPSAVLFHCAAGKDRTGVIAALLLLHAGVSSADVVADYTVSYIYIEPVLAAMRKNNSELPHWSGRSNPQTLEKVLQSLGDVESYLADCGLQQEELAALRHRLCPDN